MRHCVLVAQDHGLFDSSSGSAGVSHENLAEHYWSLVFVGISLSIISERASLSDGLLWVL